MEVLYDILLIIMLTLLGVFLVGCVVWRVLLNKKKKEGKREKYLPANSK